MAGQPVRSFSHDTLLADEAVALVGRWVEAARSTETRAERSSARTLRRLLADRAGLAFTMGFVDRVARPDADAIAADQLAHLVATHPLPRYLSPTDRLLLRAGGLAGPRLPGLVMPLARRRLRRLVGGLVVDAEPAALSDHLARRRAEGFAQNVNLLGEAVLGEGEADRRFQATIDLIDRPDVDYVSVKVSAVASQLNPWDWDGSLERVVDRLRVLLARAVAATPPTFVNLDMEEYHDLDLTIAAFTTLLDDPEFLTAEAGIVLQTYLPDSFGALRDLVSWAGARNESGGGGIKIRLVKGANLAMERVDATLHGWAQAPFTTKAEVDANYKRCVDWALRPNRSAAVRIGVASHNLFDLAWAQLLSRHRHVTERVEFEMLQGMAPAQSRVVRDGSSAGMLLYTPIVADDDFDVAISYLIRRLEENAAEGNFLRSLPELRPDSEAFEREAARFRRAVAERWSVPAGPRRSQHRPAPGAAAADGDDPAPPSFVNEPDTDPSLPASRRWAVQSLAGRPGPPTTPVTTSIAAVDAAVAAARRAQPGWAARPLAERRLLLHRAADVLARRRGDLLACMAHEAGKPLGEADPEVSEAIDFARYYGDRALDLVPTPLARFEPLGLVVIAPPWNFPVAIPAGGTMAALAAGNTVILKPAPETPGCAEIVAECLAAADLGDGVCQFVRTADDDVGRHLITSADGVILTGSTEAAQLFRSWRPRQRLFAETSGKNALVITPNADLDLAVADLVRSAFGHGGQKCSAASLAICVGDVYHSSRFRRQLIDAVESLRVGRADLPSTTVGPLIAPPRNKLERALTTLDDGERWLVEPRPLDDEGVLWRPGVRLGVTARSWFGRTECFGPVLGVMAAETLDDAIAAQNASDYGLTGGIHTLDETEVARWTARVAVGNAYVNRPITGAIVNRQPFGGWKASIVGPGAKAGGPNYVRQLGTWHPTQDPGDGFLAVAAASDARWWAEEFGAEHDPAGLFCEANVFRYRPLPAIAVRVGPRADPRAVRRVLAAAEVCGVTVVSSEAGAESDAELMARVADAGIERVRVVGEVSERLRVEAAARAVHLADGPVTAEGRVELLHYLREQTVSRTLHRFGNVTDPAPTPR
ncbi:MAG: proline dehydrogenase family protein [Acidimicrobiales bacterium]